MLVLVGGVSLRRRRARSRRSPQRGYFVLGGLSSAARVNRVQLVVKLAGFAIAAPFAAMAAGAAPALVADPDGLELLARPERRLAARCSCWAPRSSSRLA